MPRYIKRPAADFDADPDDFANAVIISGTDPIEVVSANDIEVVVQQMLLSPPTRATPNESAVPWLPTDIDGDGTPLAGLAAWFDASDPATRWSNAGGTTPALTGTVARWDDKSGNARHATAVGTGPTTGTQVSPNGKNALYFGTLAQMTLPAIGAPGAAARCAIFTVGPRRHTGDRCFGGYGSPVGGTTGSRWSLIGQAGSQNLRIEYQGGNTSSTIATEATGIFGALHDGHTTARGVLIANGTETAYNDTGITPNTTTSVFTLGGRSPTSTGSVIGDCFEIFLLAANVPLADRERLVGYSAHKFGFAGSLPAGHPYEDQPPMTGA